jgi:8-amino-7-oxononanoate synthase
LFVDESSADFTSNDYIGLSRLQSFHESIEKEIKEQHFLNYGATGSRLLAGNSYYTLLVEKEIATFHKVESCLIFNSGFDANYGLLTSLPCQNDKIILDEMVHASIHDGARASKASMIFFEHNNVKHLEQILKESKEECKYVVVESLYSMDGDFAPLTKICELCKLYNAALIVDEAHAVGVMGEIGEGLVQSLGLENEVFCRVVTFGKALGAHGAAILGSQLLTTYLVNFCRSFIFTTALASHSIAAIRVSYRLFPTLQSSRQKLFDNIKCLLENSNINGNMKSPIHKFIVGDNDNAVKLSFLLSEHKIAARPIRYPTVAKGQERIRICLHSFNSFEEIEKMCGLINEFNTIKNN